MTSIFSKTNQKSTKPIVMESGSLVEKDWEYDGIP